MSSTRSRLGTTTIIPRRLSETAPSNREISTTDDSSPHPTDNVEDRNKKRHAQPPDEYALDDPDCNFNGPQTFEFRFQLVFARLTLPRIGLDFSAAVWAFQWFSHAPPIIPPTSFASPGGGNLEKEMQVWVGWGRGGRTGRRGAGTRSASTRRPRERTSPSRSPEPSRPWRGSRKPRCATRSTPLSTKGSCLRSKWAPCATCSRSRAI